MQPGVQTSLPVLQPFFAQTTSQMTASKKAPLSGASNLVLYPPSLISHLIVREKSKIF
jgi:hypothetical protein